MMAFRMIANRLFATGVDRRACNPPAALRNELGYCRPKLDKQLEEIDKGGRQQFFPSFPSQMGHDRHELELLANQFCRSVPIIPARSSR